MNRIVIVFVLLMACGCGNSTVAPPQIERVIVISIDTLRADFLGCYGSSAGFSPHIDRFAAANIQCRDVIAQATSTASSHKSIFYSVYPAVHKLTIHKIPEESVTPPIEIIRRAGFHTAAFVGGGQMRRRFGLHKGFETYQEANWPKFKEGTLKWLTENSAKKFFLFLHTYRVHCPFEPDPVYRKKFAGWYQGDLEPSQKCSPYYNETKLDPDDVKFIRDLYGAEVNMVDDWFAQLLRQLKALQIYDSTMIVFLADHGESLGEHGYFGHNQISIEQLRIPLILRIPGYSAVRVEQPLESIDVMPTIFEVLGLKNSYTFQGRSIVPFLKNVETGKQRTRFAEQYGKVGVQRGNFLLVRSWDEQAALYDIRSDPRQENNLLHGNGSFQNRKQSAELFSQYEQLIRHSTELSSRFRVGKETPFDPESLEQLRALGYVQ